MSPKKDTQKFNGFTDEERAAMKERAKELKAEERVDKDKAAGERDVLAKIAEMPEPERAMAERLHAVIDEGAMWPTAFALKELTAAEEAIISALVKKAVS
jgi:hypothetical protein